MVDLGSHEVTKPPRSEQAFEDYPTLGALVTRAQATWRESCDRLPLVRRRLWRALVRAGALKERALGTLMPSRMRFVHFDWPLRPEVCPCDVHCCEYLAERDIRGRSVFHFGTGGHHVVGITNRDRGLDNEILGITASPPEHSRYVRLVIRSPSLGKHYKVLFADIYDLGNAGLPTFDLVTLFHLCEFSSPADPRRRMDDAGVLDLFLSKLSPGGRILFYRGSFGYQAATPLIERAVGGGKMSFVECYKSLDVYQVPERNPHRR